MARFAHLALQNHNIKPTDFMNMTIEEKAFIVASDIVQHEAVKKSMN